MTSTKNKKEFSLTLTREYIKETHRLSPKDKLEWLEEANDFINKALSPRKRKLFQAFKG